MEKKYAFLGRLALFMTALIWGTSFVILKSALDSMGTLWVLAFRFVVAAIILLAFAAKKLKNMSRECLKGSVLMGLSLAAAYIVQTYGLFYTTAGKNAFLTATYCVLTPFFAWGVYKRRPKTNNIVAAVLCVTGIGFVSLAEGFDNVNIGDILTLFCGIFYALQIVMMENYGGTGDPISISAVEFSTSALVCLAGALIFEPVPQSISGGTLLSIVYMGAICTGLAFFLEAWGMRYTSSSTAAVLLTLESVFGELTSLAMGTDILTTRLSVGFTLIFISVLLSELGFDFLKPKKAEIKADTGRS